MRTNSLSRPSAEVLRTDILAGLVVGIIAFPLSIALAVAVGVPPIAGLYTAFVAGAIATIFGGSRYNITGPTAALVPVLSHAVLAHGPGALPILGLLSGLMLLGLSLARAGRLVRYIPGTVVIGFTAGIALSIAFGQLNNLFNISGTNASLEHFHARTWNSFEHITSVRWDAPALAGSMLALLFIWRRLPRLSAVPGPLVVVVLGVALDAVLGLNVPTVAARYGDVPRELPTPGIDFFDFGLAFELLPLAFSVAVLAGIESLLSAVVADGMAATGERHDSDRELRGQGLGNIASAIFGGVPSTAAIARTAAGIRSGGRTRIVGVTHALVVLGATVLLGSLAGKIPMAVLAAILVYVAWNIAEAPEVWRLVTRAPRGDALVVVVTALITLTFDLTYAIGFGVIASMWMLLRQLVRIPAAQKMLPDDNGHVRKVSPELSAMMRERPDIAFFNAEGLLSFYSAATFEYELNGHASNPLVLRMKDVHHIDATGLLTLEGIIEHRRKNGGRIVLTAIQPDLRPVLDRFGILRLLGPENIFEQTSAAIAALDQPAARAERTAGDASAAGA